MLWNNPRISVIIPLYNGAKYIRRCLNSIVSQDYTNLEICVVDDGSTDEGALMAEAFLTSSDVEWMVFHQRNAGQGAARNIGLDHVTGDFLTFVDQDDTIPAGTFKRYIETVKDSDIVIGGFQHVELDGRVRATVRLQDTSWARYKIIAPWGKFYRRSFLVENQLRYACRSFGEDIFFLIAAYACEPKMVVVSDIVYEWLYNRESLSNTLHRMICDETDILALYDQILAIPNLGNIRESKELEYFFMKTAIYYVLKTMRQSSFKESRECVRNVAAWFRREFPDCMLNPYLKIGNVEEPIGVQIAVSVGMRIVMQNTKHA